MSDSDKMNDEEEKLRIESQLRKSLGDVLVTTSGAWDKSLISQDPFSYSQLAQFSSNLLADALSKSKIEINTLSQSIRNQFEEEQRMLIENAKSSITEPITEQVRKQIEEQQEMLRESFKSSLAEQINKAAYNMEQDRMWLYSKIGNQIQDEQKMLIENFKTSLAEQINKAALKIEKDRVALQSDLLKSISDSTSKLKDEIQKSAFKEFQSKLIEQAKQSLTEEVQEAFKRNLRKKSDDNPNYNK